MKIRARAALFLAMFLVFSTVAAQAHWEQVPGEASAIAIGANGDVWTIGTIRESGGFGVYRWDGEQLRKVGGIAGVRIAVDANGAAWVVDSFNNLRRWNGATWQDLPGWARDVAVAANGAVWSVGLEGGLYQYGGTRMEKLYPGGFSRIALAPDGEPWPIDEKQQLVRRGPAGWYSLRSETSAVAIGPAGSVWILDSAGAVFRLDASGGWLRRDGRFREIAVGPDGLPWAVSADGRIFRRMPDD